MPKADEFFGMGKLMESMTEYQRGVIYGLLVVAIGCVFLAAYSIDDSGDKLDQQFEAGYYKGIYDGAMSIRSDIGNDHTGDPNLVFNAYADYVNAYFEEVDSPYRIQKIEVPKYIGDISFAGDIPS